MEKKDYQRFLLELLLKKYNERQAKYIGVDKPAVNRRIIVKPTELYREYSRNNADLWKKQEIHEAVSVLEGRRLVSTSHLRFSEDIEKIYFSEENIDDLYGYLWEAYGITPKRRILKKVYEIIETYAGAGGIVRKYCEKVLAEAEDPKKQPDPERIEANLRILHFLENNKENLYVREVSMLVYGESKWFEENNYEEVCSFLREVTGMPAEEGEKKDGILFYFFVTPMEQEIFIKGNWILEWEAHSLNVSKFQGGIAIASGDIPHIKKIHVNGSCVMTIENKTSFQRKKDRNTAMMYLGGFANRHQTEFLKKVISDNPDIRYAHFGDIDIGGFLIHRHLCRETGYSFSLYAMGVQQLQDENFRHCLRGLTDLDRSRMLSLMEEEPYREVLQYMLEYNVKLEQEIVSYYENLLRQQNG